MKIVSLKALEENLKLFITNPETTDDTEEAARQAKTILKYNKDSSYANYALALHETEQANRCAPMADYSKVIKKYEKIIEKDENFIEAYLMLGKIYEQIDKQKQHDILAKAHKQFPDQYLIMFDLANIKLFHTGEKELALELFTKCVQMLPQVDSAWASLGTAYSMNRELEMAKTCYETALSINPDKLSAVLGMGVYYFENADFKKAREYYERSLMINKDSFWGTFNIALLEILEGNFEKGMELYEKRDKEHFVKAYGGSAWPELLKKDVVKGSNEKVVVLKEQGFGDDIMFARYLNHFHKLGYNVTYAAAPELLDLFKLSPDLDKINISSSIETNDVTTFDYRTFLVSLPHITSNYIKGKPEPLKIDMKRINNKDLNIPEKLKKSLSSKKIKVGLCWSGSPKHWRDKNRSIEIKNFQNLLKNKNVEFFGIQKVYKKEDKKFINKYKNFHNCSDVLSNFVHTAYLVDNMDIILTVDTSLVHLSGSIGKNTYLYLPKVPDWRWGLKDKQDWYKSVHLLRQRDIDDWSIPLKESEEILKKLSS